MENGLENNDRAKYIVPGNLWIRTDGTMHVISIDSYIDAQGDVLISDANGENSRKIDWFKLTYRYRPFLFVE